MFVWEGGGVLTRLVSIFGQESLTDTKIETQQNGYAEQKYDKRLKRTQDVQQIICGLISPTRSLEIFFAIQCLKYGTFVQQLWSFCPGVFSVDEFEFWIA
jgi:hypothetical protein